MMADQNKDGRRDEPPKDDPPADPKDENQPPQLSLEQMESLAAQVTQTILKQLAGGGAKAIGDQQAGSSSSSQPGEQGEHGML